MFILQYLISPFLLLPSPLYLNVVVVDFIPLIISNLFGFQSRKAHAFLLWNMGGLLASEGFEEQWILLPLCLALEGGTQSLPEPNIPGPIAYILHDRANGQWLLRRGGQIPNKDAVGLTLCIFI